ncbi:hypothetical protein ACFL5H_03045 [Candidatus Latescibacterota bacterium]
MVLRRMLMLSTVAVVVAVSASCGSITGGDDEKDTINPDDLIVENAQIQNHYYDYLTDAVTVTTTLRNNSSKTLTEVWLSIEVQNIDDVVVGQSKTTPEEDEFIMPGESLIISEYFDIIGGYTPDDAAQVVIRLYCEQGNGQVFTGTRASND